MPRSRKPETAAPAEHAALIALADLDAAMCTVPGMPEDPGRYDQLIATWMRPFFVHLAGALVPGTIIPDRIAHLAALVGVDLAQTPEA